MECGGGSYQTSQQAEPHTAKHTKIVETHVKIEFSYRNLKADLHRSTDVIETPRFACQLLVSLRR